MSNLFAHESMRLASFLWKSDIWLESEKLGQLPESCLVYMIEKPQMSSDHQMFGIVRLTPDPLAAFFTWELLLSMFEIHPVRSCFHLVKQQCAPRSLAWRPTLAPDGVHWAGGREGNGISKRGHQRAWTSTEFFWGYLLFIFLVIKHVVNWSWLQGLFLINQWDKI